MGVNGIYGLSGSGLDIESMVKVGMMSRQSEYDKMAQKYTLNEWKKADYIELNNQITTFNMSALTDYKLSSSTKARTAESSNELAVMATANSTAPTMNHRVDVESLSSNAYLISSKSMSQLTGSVSNISLKDIFFNGLSNETKTVTSVYDSIIKTSNNNTDTYSFSGSPNGVLTKTNLTVTGGKISSFNYTGADSSTTLGSGATVSNQTTEFISGEKTSTFDFTTDFGLTVNFKANRDTSGNTTGQITIDSNGTYQIVYDSTSGSPAMTFTSSSDPSKKLIATLDSRFNIKSVRLEGINDGNGGTTTKTLTEDDTGATVTYGADTITKTTTTFSDGTVLDTTETRKADGSITDITAATIQTKETGITGKTAGDTNTVSADFLDGKARTVQSSDTAIAFKISDGEGDSAHSFEIKYKYSDILDGKKTINDFVSEINSAASKSSSNVRASYDNVSGRFYLYNTKSSNEDKVSITALTTGADNRGSTTFAGQATMDFFNTLGLKQSSGGNLIAPANYNEEGNLIKQYSASGLQLTTIGTAETVSGSYGKVKIDGVEYDKIQDNKLTVAGVTYNFLNTTGTADSNGVTTDPVTVSVTQDNEEIIKKVKSFVESYNKILGSLYEKYDEKNDSNYKPLTQSQKDSMKDEQVEKWEEKAKKGMLYHDSTLSKIISDMRNAITASVEVDDKKYSVFSLGIGTTGLKGQLTLDEEKLKNALDENGDVVYNVFSKLTTKIDSKTGKEVTDYDKSGVAQRLSDIFTNATKLLKSRAGSSNDITEDSDLNNLLRELQTKMSNFKKMMSAFEDKLYKKYDAMEVALSKLGMQLNFITGGQ